ncbi:MAG: amidase [Acidimicrobiales bacterium]
MAEDLHLLDATAQAALVASGEASPAELVEVALDRIDRLNPQLNAVIHERADAARAEAAGVLPDGPFRGVPMVVKDLDGWLAGEPYHAGNRGLRDRGFRPAVDSELFARFRRAGFVIVGKTNTPELGLMPSTEPLAYGPTRNPWDVSRSTGGSSGGSGAAVAACLVPVGHAGDGGGSIRIPASECGLVGLLPTRGRITLGPEAGESWGGLVRRLVVSRSVRDTAGVLDAVAGPMPGDPYVAPAPSGPYRDELRDAADPLARGQLRIGVTTSTPDPNVVCDPQVVAAVDAAAQACASLGHAVERSAPAAWDDAEASAAFAGHFVNTFTVWAAADLDRYGALTGAPLTADEVEPGTWAIAEMGRHVTALQYHAAVEATHAYTRDLARWWSDGFDVLMTPTIPELPPTLGQFTGTVDEPLVGLARAAGIVPFTAPFNATGQPAISLPLGWSAEGLPIGVQLVAAAGREDVLLRLAAQLELACPWSDRRPPVV